MLSEIFRFFNIFYLFVKKTDNNISLARRPKVCRAKLNLARQTHAMGVVELLRHHALTFNKSLLPLFFILI